jgi:hypothetical protein
MKDNVISIVINLDTRPGIFAETTTAETMLQGTRSIDFLTEGVRNKKAFFYGFDIETILFVDSHETIPPTTMQEMLNIADTVVVSKHREYFDVSDYYPKWNDLNYWNAVSLAKGKWVAHFDADMAAFCKNGTVIQGWLQWLDSDKYEYISYPSHWSPVAVDDPDFLDYMWVSTRFFLCKRSTIQFDEILKCMSDSDYLYAKHPVKRRCPWFEHILGLLSQREKIFYPKIEPDRFLIFAWDAYRRGKFTELNNMNYSDVRDFVMNRGINYPCNVNGG